MSFFIIGFILFLAMGFLYWASRSPLRAGTRDEDIFHYSGIEAKPKSLLKVMTWNFAYAYGLGSEGKNYTAKSREEYEKRLNEAARLIQKYEPDLIFLQELDHASHRTFYVNQGDKLARACGYSYFAPSVSWFMNYVPFPYWPLSQHFGKSLSGGGILSRYPIVKNETFLFDKRAKNPWWYNLFYPYRYFQKIQLQLPQGEFTAVNLHLEAFDPDERKNQMGQMKDKFAYWADKPILIAGDFNTHQEHTISMGDDYQEIISGPTFPSSRATKTLDHIFYRGLRAEKVEVIEQGVSDHHPILVTFSF